MKKLPFFVLYFCGSYAAVVAQNKVISKSDTSFCVPSVEGLSRPKGFVIKEEIVLGHVINSSSTQGATSSTVGQIKAVRRREIKFKAPLINNEGLKVAIGFKYKVEDVFFEDRYRESLTFYQNLENKNLKQLGTSVYVLKPLRGNVYFLMRASASLNGDYGSNNAPTKDYLKYSIAPMIGWKKTPYLSYAIGVGYSENLGKLSLFPLLSYNQTFTQHFGFESILPLNIKLRYSTLDQKNFIYLSSEVKGSTYNVKFRNGDTGYLNNTELRHLVTYEREVYDFVWVSLEAGLRSNLNFSLSDSPDYKNSIVISNDVNQSFFVGFSIFIVPPKKFFQ